MWPDPTTSIPGSLKLLPTDENGSSPRVGSGGQRDQNYFHDNTETLFAFFPSSSPEHMVEFSRGYVKWDDIVTSDS